jgi:hypothetical protein
VCCLRLAATRNWKGCTSEGRQRSAIAILFKLCSSDIRIQSGCRLPNWTFKLVAVSGPNVLLKKEGITSRTWLWADALASLNFGHTQAKCVRDSKTASEPCYSKTFQIRLDRIGLSHIFEPFSVFCWHASSNDLDTAAPSLETAAPS